MAEINIERKERSTWPWILLGLLLVALLAWWLLSRNDGARDFATSPDTTGAMIDTGAMAGTGTGMAGSGGVSEFVRWSDDNRARQDADTTHAFTTEGIRLLAGAIVEVAERDTTGSAMIRQRADSMRSLADALERNWHSNDHAQYARRAFSEAASALQTLREQRFPEAATTVRQVQQAAERVQGNRPLLEQRQSVQHFFDVASQTLQSMRGAAGSTTS